MTIACNIKRNQGRVVSVKAPNGKPSLLFKSLKSFLGDSNKAADYWLLTYTDLFKKSKGDWTNPKDTSIEVDKNGEPILSEVLSYIGENKTGQSLPLQDRLDLYNNLQVLGGLDIEDIYDKLNEAFFKEDGNFAPTRKSLKDSGLYNELEIDLIMSDIQVQNNVEGLINRLSLTRDRNGEIPTTSTVQQNPPETTVDTNDLIGIGKFRVLPYEDTFKEIASKVAGITNRKAFDQAIQDVELPSVVSRYNQNKQFANYIFNKYSDLKAIPVVTDRNGRLEQQIENDTADTIETTLIVDADKEGVRENIDTLMSIEDDVWNDSPSEVGVLLDEITDKLKDSNIDLRNLSNAPLSPKEYRTFLTSLRDFIDKMDNGVLDSQDIQEFALEYDRAFFIERTPEYNYTQNPTNAAIFQLDTRKSEIEVYRDYAMIKVRDNVYRKVQDKPIETLYEEFRARVANNTIFGKIENRVVDGKPKIPDNDIVNVYNKSTVLGKIGDVDIITIAETVKQWLDVGINLFSPTYGELSNTVEFFNNRLNGNNPSYSDFFGRVEESTGVTFEDMGGLLKVLERRLDNYEKKYREPLGVNGKRSVTTMRNNYEQQLRRGRDLPLVVKRISAAINPPSQSNTQEKIVIYKMAFGYDVGSDVTTISDNIRHLSEYDGDTDYLTTDFVADFKNYILLHQGTPIYDYFFRHFEFTDGVIKLNADFFTTGVLRDLTNQSDNKMFRDLLNYARISKHDGIKSILSTEGRSDTPLTVSATRAYYASNLQDAYLVGVFAKKGKFLLSKEGVSERFVQSDGKLYEGVTKYRGVDIYSEVVVNDNKDFLLSPVPPTPPKDLRVFDNLIQPSNTELEIETLYDSTELKEINDKIDSCGS